MNNQKEAASSQNKQKNTAKPNNKEKDGSAGKPHIKLAAND